MNLSSLKSSNRKSTGKLRETGTTHCQHVHFFQGFVLLHICLYIKLQNTKTVNLRLHVFLFLLLVNWTAFFLAKICLQRGLFFYCPESF